MHWKVTSRWFLAIVGPLARASRRPLAAATLGLAAILSLTTVPVLADDVKVMISGGFSAAYRELVPEFERATGNKVITVAGPSMGATPQAIPNRLARGEDADALIMVGEALDKLAAQSQVIPE